MRVWNTIDSTALACRIHFQFWQTCQVASVSDARDVPARDRPALKLIRTRHSFTQDSVGLNRRSTKGVCIWQIGPRRPSATIRGIGAQSRDVLLRTKIGDRGISTNLNNSPLTRCRFLITFASVYNLLVKVGGTWRDLQPGFLLAAFSVWTVSVHSGGAVVPNIRLTLRNVGTGAIRWVNHLKNGVRKWI
jgi:hypothetical protein